MSIEIRQGFEAELLSWVDDGERAFIPKWASKGSVG